MGSGGSREILRERDDMQSEVPESEWTPYQVSAGIAVCVRAAVPGIISQGFGHTHDWFQTEQTGRSSTQGRANHRNLYCLVQAHLNRAGLGASSPGTTSPRYTRSSTLSSPSTLW